jgi:hypothetical protein
MLYWGDQQAGRTPCGFASPAALVLHGGGSIQKFGRITGAPYLGRRNQKAQQVTKKTAEIMDSVVRPTRQQGMMIFG